MFAVARLVVHTLRARWRSWAGLAVIVAVAGGAVLAAAAGASRTDTAYPRFLAGSRSSDVLVSPANSGDLGYDMALGALPGVAAVGPVVGINAVPANARGVPDNGAVMVAALDDRYARTMDVPKMLAGRLPSQETPGEVAVDPIGAEQLHLHVGSVLRMAAIDSSNHARPFTVHVVGVFVTRGSIVPVNYLDNVPQIWGSLALYRELGPAYVAFDGAYLNLKSGTSVAAFTAAAEKLAQRYPQTGKQVFVADEATQAATVERAIRPQAVALALFALALALTALLVVGQVAARTLLTATQDNGTLAALGMTRRQLFAASMAATAAATVTGAVGAVAIAVAASPLTPIGPARLAEPHPGVSVNAGVLAAGAAAIVVLLAARVAVTAWRQAGARPAADEAEPSRHRGRLAERLARAGAPLAAVTGVRFALDPGAPGGAGGARAGVPVRSAMLGLAVAVAAVAGAATFGANLLRLVSTPSQYGQTWDMAWNGQFVSLTPKQFSQIAGHVPGISDVTYGVQGSVTIGETVIPAIGLARGTGPMLSPTLLDGRPPATDGEIALGSSVLRQLGKQVGQMVTVSTSAGTRAMRITGSAVFPYFGQGSFTPTDAGEGAETTAAVLAESATAADGAGGYQFALVSFAPGPARQAHVAAFERAWQSFCASIQQSTCLVTDQRPNTVNNYAAIDSTPEILAAVLTVLGVAVLAQFILASARRRRRDFALLKVLGMFRRELGAVAFWQVATVTAVALAVGVPLGVAGGRWAWQLFANQAGLDPGTITPLSVLWMIPATLLVAALVALPPAMSVARVPAAATLRSE
ncbi:MAG TPA: ABC transporter permease [Trebonia sp.]|jgi:ABC-type antimicrobial peptide transport system permease subunit|nr:ABC transporter permease [Trebonia sp.]